jgi:membrane-bound metal-dependent hydrolase YbcI (DUF457 family)
MAVNASKIATPSAPQTTASPWIVKEPARSRMAARFWILSALFSVLPDIDVLGFPLGIRYEDMLGHRGLSHLLFFAFVLSWIVAFLTFPRLPERWTRFLLFSYFFAVTASHGALDAMTDGGLGIAFFAPFDNTRYFFRSGLSRSHLSGFHSSAPADSM